MRKIAAIAVVAVLMFIFAVYTAMNLPPSPSPILKDNYRILFFHLPSAIGSFFAFTVTMAASILYLIKRDYRYDLIAKNFAVAGFYLITAALISGSIWANVAWGAFWNWDPRETAVLITWFVYAAYHALRQSIDAPDDRARISAIYSIFAYVTIPFSYFSSQIFFSLHPKVESISLEIGMPLGIAITSFILLVVVYAAINYRLDRFEEVILNE
ncbi:cytochrome c biogenesis protein CcsA [Geoglobus acetivorans]|uniref:Cytochrome c biogenesis protein n=1 Tax=Geoglobus acetivorans TaxID=565033 RepID=A0ABZ3H675_GEOAI|nr:cytochrome c biogenesis protein [Geoglobus acetivorans]